jgi:hypothetical protein
LLNSATFEESGVQNKAYLLGPYLAVPTCNLADTGKQRVAELPSFQVLKSFIIFGRDETRAKRKRSSAEKVLQEAESIRTSAALSDRVGVVCGQQFALSPQNPNRITEFGWLESGMDRRKALRWGRNCDRSPFG